MSRAWRVAFHEQARSDFGAFETLRSAGAASCHSLHYRQMATEKLAKAVAIAGGRSADEVRRSHVAFVRFLQTSARNHTLSEILGWERGTVRHRVQQLLPIAYRIERLAPALSQGGPNTEYPWQEANGDIRAPASYRFEAALDLRTQTGRNLVNSIRAMIQRFDELC